MNNKFYCILMLLFTVLPCSAQETSLHKKISVDLDNTLLSYVFKDIEKITGATINCADGIAADADRVTCAYQDTEAGRILTRILLPRRLKISSIKGNSVTIVKQDPYEEFRIKREELYEFAEKPKASVKGDNVTISFETKGFPDCTVAVEDASGEIVRHLASGVLGLNAPEPFQWNSKKQVLIWDGKDNKGRYVDDKGSVTVRVSLGLKPQFERGLFWSPYKRVGSYAPIMCARPEGVYVSEGFTSDSVRLFDHEGNYVRTIFPFPAGKLDKVAGLEKHTVLQTRRSLPRKTGMQQAALLTSGSSCLTANHLKFGGGFAATAMAVQGDRIALAFLNLNRLKTDGSTGGLPLKGPATGFVVPRGTLPYQQIPMELGPSSAAFSPDGKTLYLTGYVLFNWHGYARHGVYKVSYEKDSPPEVFAGNMKSNGYGTDNSHFAIPNSVACDSKGRVYVADYVNSRIQIFDPDGKHLKTIPTPWPAKVQIDPHTQEIYIYSWHICTGMSNDLINKYSIPDYYTLNKKIKPTLTRLGPFEKPDILSHWSLPVDMAGKSGQQSWIGQLLHLEMDFWAEQPTLWMVGRRFQVNLAQIGHLGAGVFKGQQGDDAARTGILLLVKDGTKWKKVRSFGEQAQKDVARIKPPDFGIQRLYANEKTHKFYLLEHISFTKAHHTLIEIDPVTGKVNKVPMPFGAEDICFDQEGYIYLRTEHEVVRYELPSWREVPWDYGEEREEVTYGAGKSAKVLSALILPGNRPGCYHQSGMWVSPKGHIAVHCFNQAIPPKSSFKGPIPTGGGKAYTPLLYPGRLRLAEIHIWDRHGKLIREDTAPGLGTVDGLGIDKDDNIYVMFRAPRYSSEKPYPPHWIWQGTVIKFRARDTDPRSVRVLTVGSGKGEGYGVPLPLTDDRIPKRPPDTLRGGDYGTFHGKTWMTGAEWFYSGCGIVGNSCSCYHTRFQMDAFARSFAPEPDLFSVAVLDSNGNLITHIGKYGSTDDGIPIVPHSALRAPRSIGGDEVPLFYPAYVGVDTDRRLFVSDIGNARIVSVKLGYHKEERISLRQAEDRK